MTTRSTSRKPGKPGGGSRLKDRLKANSRRAVRPVRIYLRGDLYAEIEDLVLQLAQVEARTEADERLAGNGEARALALRIEALREEMADSLELFKLRALPPGGWSKLLAMHPPREGNVQDMRAGVNLDLFNHDLVRASVIYPEMDEDDWTALLDPDADTCIADAQYADLVNTAWDLNQNSISVPFSPAALRNLPTSED